MENLVLPTKVCNTKEPTKGKRTDKTIHGKMIPFHIMNDLNQKLEFLLHALVEKKEGKVPSRDEIHHHCSTMYENHRNKEDGSVTDKMILSWKGGKLITLVVTQSADGNTIIGEFEGPNILDDEFIVERLKAWTN